MRQGEKTAAPPLQRVSREGPLPLSFAQQRLWFIDQLEPGNAVYNCPRDLRIHGQLNREKLCSSFTEILTRHWSLRTAFRLGMEQEPVQLVQAMENLQFRVEEIDLRHLESGEREAEAQRLAQEEAERGFDLSRGPLLRVKLLRLEAEDHVLLLTMHHIASDAWSLGVLVREFVELYTAEKELNTVLKELEVQYGDYAVWQRNWLHGETLEKQLGYWKKQLAGIEPLELPTDRPRTSLTSRRGETLWLEMGEELTKKLKELSRQQGVTLFMTLLAALQVLLARYTGKHDVVVGTPIANRTQCEIEQLIGFFVNTLVLRGEVRAEKTFRELLEQTREATLGAYANQDLPFEKLVEELQPARDRKRDPLFQVMLSVQNAPQEELNLPGLRIQDWKPLGREVAKSDLAFSALERAGNINIGTNYAADLYASTTIEQMARHFRQVLEEVSRNADCKIGEIQMLSESERSQIVTEWNSTDKQHKKLTIVGLFEEQAKKTPGATAAECARERLTYEQLNRRSNQLGHYLMRLGVGPEVLVGICMDRSLEMMIAILGVLKAGGAYVPLDPAYPAERLGYMLDESQMSVLLTQEKLRGKLPSSWAQVVSLDVEWNLIETESAENLEQQPQWGDLAYVIYTSGSTGKPKGVAVTHEGLSNYLQWAAAYYRISETGHSSVSPVHSSLGFDLTVTSIFPALLAGKCISLLPPGNEINALAAGLQTKNAYSLVKATPSHLKLLSALLPRAEHVDGAEALIIGGESLSYQDLSFWLKQSSKVRLINEYGPTETVVGCCVYEVDRDRVGDGPVPSGKPISNTQLYVLDKEMQLVPIGVAGELYIGGAGLARGYIHRPDLTAGRFVPNPFAGTGGQRLYRTGDRVRWMQDGNLEYLGRLDQQMKIRGFRIELNEIAAALQEHPAVQQAVVAPWESQAGDQRLVAYVVPDKTRAYPLMQRSPLEQSREFDSIALDELSTNQLAADLRTHLSSKLPEYMVPAAYVPLEKLPLTPNGKIDTKALPSPQFDSEFSRPISPRTPVEQKLANIWREVLGLEQVGIEDNFFERGGHSLLGAKLIARIQNVFGIDLPLRTIFDQPTIAAQGSLLEAEILLPISGPLIPLQKKCALQEGALRPLFCIHPFFGLAHCYKKLAELLGTDQPLYGLQARGIDEGEIPLTTIPEMAACYIRAIRSVQPEGPYQLAGWSMGSIVAFEMAQQLVEAGMTVSFLGLFEGRPPHHSSTLHAHTMPGGQEVLAATREKELLAHLGADGLNVEEMNNLSAEEWTALCLDRVKIIHQEFNDLSLPQFRRLLRVSSFNLLALESYDMKPYSGEASLFRVPLSAGQDESYGWTQFVKGKLETFECPGTHQEFMSGACVASVAALLKQCLHAGAPSGVQG
ncbi:MAG TPA: amino acid adenylation domain-containing protein [Candidatus Angelobacter sp.]|jgi:amino acid adenylation domain-containing protein